MPKIAVGGLKASQRKKGEGMEKIQTFQLGEDKTTPSRVTSTGVGCQGLGWGSCGHSVPPGAKIWGREDPVTGRGKKK